MTDYYQIRKKGRDLESKMAVLDQQVSDGAVVRRKDSFLSRLFPNEFQKEAARHQLRLVRSEFEFREKAVGILRDTQLQAIGEMCKDHLIKGETPRKRELAEFVMEQKVKLDSKLMDLTEDFHARISRAYENAEKLPIPALRDRAIESIHENIDSYHAMSAQLQQRFQDIIDDAARRYGM